MNKKVTIPEGFTIIPKGFFIVAEHRSEGKHSIHLCDVIDFKEQGVPEKALLIRENKS